MALYVRGGDNYSLDRRFIHNLLRVKGNAPFPHSNSLQPQENQRLIIRRVKRFVQV